MAGIAGHALNNSLIRGSTASTTDPDGARSYFGGPSARTAARTVFREHPTNDAIALIGIFSARCNRLISAQSSTDNTHFLLTSTEIRLRAGGVSFQLPPEGQFSRAADIVLWSSDPDSLSSPVVVWCFNPRSDVEQGWTR